MAFWGNIVDNVGTALNLPEVGLSEWLAGGNKTDNTGRIDFSSTSPSVARGGTNPQHQAWQTAMKQVDSSGGTGTPTGVGAGVGSTGACGVSCGVLSVSLIYRYYTLDKAVIEDAVRLYQIA